MNEKIKLQFMVVPEKLVESGVLFWFEGKLAKKLIEKGIAEEIVE